MEKNLYIDASHPDETRIVLKSENHIEEYEYENKNKLYLKNNIYLGKVSRIEPSLQAAFVNYGKQKHGFLAFNDIQTQYYQIPLADKELILKEEEELRKELEEETNELSPEDSNSSNESESDDSEDDSTEDASDEDLKNSEDGEDSSETESPELEKNSYEKKISDCTAACRESGQASSSNRNPALGTTRSQRSQAPRV